MTKMTKQMVCPICQTVNVVDESSVGCYVLCRNCPHRFYVPVPPLGEKWSDESTPVANVVPDYKAWEKQMTSRAEGIEALAAELRWHRMLLLLLLAAQGVIGLMTLFLLYRASR
jgi:transcription elongation factor Elf1